LYGEGDWGQAIGNRLKGIRLHSFYISSLKVADAQIVYCQPVPIYRVLGSQFWWKSKH